MDPNLIIDDDYVKEVGRLCRNRGRNLDEVLTNYIAILEEIKKEAIVEGEIAQALESYYGCVVLMKKQLTEISINVRGGCNRFIVDINNADDYLF